MVMRKRSVEWTQAMVWEGSTCFEENTQTLRTALDDVPDAKDSKERTEVDRSPVAGTYKLVRSGHPVVAACRKDVLE